MTFFSVIQSIEGLLYDGNYTKACGRRKEEQGVTPALRDVQYCKTT